MGKSNAATFILMQEVRSESDWTATILTVHQNHVLAVLSDHWKNDGKPLIQQHKVW